MRTRRIVLKLVKQESVVEVLQDLDVHVPVGPVVHRLEHVGGLAHLRDKYLRRFAHHEDWEVVFVVGVLGFHVVQNGRKSVLVSQVDDGLVTVSGHVNTVDLSQKVKNLFICVEIRNRDDSDARLLQELDMRLGNVRSLILGHVAFLRLVLFVEVHFGLHVTSKWLGKDAVNGSSVVGDINDVILIEFRFCVVFGFMNVIEYLIFVFELTLLF